MRNEVVVVALLWGELLLFLLLYPAMATFVMSGPQKALLIDETEKIVLGVDRQMEVHTKLLKELIIAEPDALTLTDLGKHLTHGETRDFPKLSIEEQETKLRALCLTVTAFLTHELPGQEEKAREAPDKVTGNAPHLGVSNSLTELLETTELLNDRVSQLIMKQPRRAPKEMNGLLVTQFLDTCRKNREIVDKVFTQHLDFLRLLNVEGNVLTVVHYKEAQHDQNAHVSNFFLETVEMLRNQNMRLLDKLEPYSK